MNFQGCLEAVEASEAAKIQLHFYYPCRRRYIGPLPSCSSITEQPLQMWNDIDTIIKMDNECGMTGPPPLPYHSQTPSPALTTGMCPKSSKFRMNLLLPKTPLSRINWVGSWDGGHMDY